MPMPLLIQWIEIWNKDYWPIQMTENKLNFKFLLLFGFSVKLCKGKCISMSMPTQIKTC